MGSLQIPPQGDTAFIAGHMPICLPSIKEQFTRNLGRFTTKVDEFASRVTSHFDLLKLGVK